MRLGANGLALASALAAHRSDWPAARAALDALFRLGGLGELATTATGPLTLASLTGSKSSAGNGQPVVSVLMAVHNLASRVATAIGSIRAQTLPDWELLIVDDGSSDDTAAVAAAASNGDPRVKILRHECNRGLFIARNTALHAARGRYVTVLDGDDWAHPQRLKNTLLN